MLTLTLTLTLTLMLTLTLTLTLRSRLRQGTQPLWLTAGRRPAMHSFDPCKQPALRCPIP